MVEVLEDGDLIVDGKDGVAVATEELLLEDLDGDVLLSVPDELAEVDFAGVALAEGLDDFVLAIENGVSLLGVLSLHCDF